MLKILFVIALTVMAVVPLLYIFALVLLHQQRTLSKRLSKVEKQMEDTEAQVAELDQELTAAENSQAKWQTDMETEIAGLEDEAKANGVDLSPRIERLRTLVGKMVSADAEAVAATPGAAAPGAPNSAS